MLMNFNARGSFFLTCAHLMTNNGGLLPNSFLLLMLQVSDSMLSEAGERFRGVVPATKRLITTGRCLKSCIQADTP